MSERPVIFRKFPNGELIALFPTEPGNLRDTSIKAYTFSTKETETDISIMRVTEAADPFERDPLLVEVVRAYPRDSLPIKLRITEEFNELRKRRRSAELSMQAVMSDARNGTETSYAAA